MSIRRHTVRPGSDNLPADRPTPTHCRVAVASSEYSGEQGRLLHARLRVVALIAVLPLLFFLVRNLSDPVRRALIDPVGLGLHAIVTVVIAGVTALLWFRRGLMLCTLRHLELLLFGSLITFFVWLQLHLLRNATLFQAAEGDCGLGVVRLWIEGSALRWFFLIVIYGVFIPSTWKRAALLTGVATLLPLALTPVGAWWYDRLCPEVWYGVLDLGILLATGLAVAVFGAHRLAVLQRQAFQAKRLGQYQLERKLGEGGMGEVYEAEHVLLRRRCAIKLIRPEQTRDPSALARFEREVRAMASLTHWNTVEIYDYGRTEDGIFYYAMEYLDGSNLEAMVARHGPLSPERVIHFLRQVCGALREAHATGLLHRDIKPSNIIACKRGGIHDRVKLLDFGLVQVPALGPEALRLTTQGAVLGSPPYMAPEQAQGRSDLDVRTDVYSLGGVGYYLLTGQPPFPRETPMEMMLAHAYDPVIPPGELRPGVPLDLEAVVLRCLAKKREGRFGSVEELDLALSCCAAADRWTEEQATLWWREHHREEETPAPAAPTLVSR